MQLNTLKQHRKLNLKKTQDEIAVAAGMQMGRISAFECGYRIPNEYQLQLAAAYKCSLEVLMALNRGDTIEVENNAPRGNVYFITLPGGKTNGQGIGAVANAGDAGSVPGLARVDGTGVGHDATPNRKLRGRAAIKNQRGVRRTPAAKKVLASDHAGAAAGK